MSVGINISSGHVKHQTKQLAVSSLMFHFSLERNCSGHFENKSRMGKKTKNKEEEEEKERKKEEEEEKEEEEQEEEGEREGEEKKNKKERGQKEEDRIQREEEREKDVCAIRTFSNHILERGDCNFL
ncbi:hypothetical protein M8J76_002670 [Diaphorina citri]|nr:hypothetical protein M8J76_002670 [Diaphorina citri]